MEADSDVSKMWSRAVDKYIASNAKVIKPPSAVSAVKCPMAGRSKRDTRTLLVFSLLRC